MSTQKAIEHSGFIEEITESGAKVRFISESACASCHAKGACSASDMEDKEVFIPGMYKDYKKGDPVQIIMRLSQGNQAVLFGYVYPLLAFVFMLLILSSAGLPEQKAGFFSLLFLIPYYLTLYLFKNKINKKFSFSIRKYE